MAFPVMVGTRDVLCIQKDRLRLRWYEICSIMAIVGDHRRIDVQETIGAGEFKSKCLKLLDQVAEERQTLVITKRGRAVARVVPMEAEVEIFGALRGSGTILGDIISPLENEWEVCQ